MTIGHSEPYPEARHPAEWLRLVEADEVIIDELSPDGLAAPEYARFRNFLFDAGFVPLRFAKADRAHPNIVYTRSNLLRDTSLAGISGSHFVSMTSLGHQGRFGNQIWQYLFLRMYGLRNGLSVRVPEWQGEKIFGFTDERPVSGQEYQAVSLLGSRDIDLELWEIDDAPRNVDFKGYFQNVPPHWRVHHHFIRSMFTMRSNWTTPLTALTDSLFVAGRTLIAIHVRRGDFKRGQHVSPLFRLVPVEWYLKFLDEIWPRLPRPVLHVATDEPSEIKPFFNRFEQLDAGFLKTDFGMPDHVIDYALLRESDHLVACNSSFSASAALLGKPTQHCYIVDFAAERFASYDPWSELSFTRRFVPEARSINAPGYGLHGARRRVLAMTTELDAKARLEVENQRLRAHIRALEADRLSRLGRLMRRGWRAVRMIGAPEFRANLNRVRAPKGDGP